MNTRSVLLGIFATLTVLFAAVSVIEYEQGPSPGVTQTVFRTLTTTTFIPSYFYYASTNVSIPISYVMSEGAFSTEFFNGTSTFAEGFYDGSTGGTNEPCYCPPDATCTCYYTTAQVTTSYWVGDYTGFFTFSVAQVRCCPLEATCACTTTAPTTLTFEVTFQVSSHVPEFTQTYAAEPVTFTWWGAGHFPTPSSASLFGGGVKLKWFSNQSDPSLPYLNVSTDSNVTISSPLG